MSHKLVCHPQTPSRIADAIEVGIQNAGNGILALSFGLQGDLAALRIPAQRPCRRVDGLWRHTCFEVFLMEGNGPAYREYNFSPSGEWAAYGFLDYRQAGVLPDESAPAIRVHRKTQCLTLEAEISIETMPVTRSIRLGLSAVVETIDGNLSYWALQHPPGEPNFHHVDAFALQLDGAWSCKSNNPLTGAPV